ncbi:hypothetical protein RHSP_01265 [Rhizobium freirei PRF 81]|uniref:Uncharacterized protein n=1 Tax=Rhizobium freirei PRF 81 TaxID=363754 RepID=N6V5K7_9HYPH|nr:hypothetical protein RHSP_01265 [Rhizobium freirei PRF 81]
MDRMPAGSACAFDIRKRIVDEDRRGRVEAETPSMGIVDGNIRFDQPDIARYRDAARLGEERIAHLRLAKRVGSEIGQHSHIATLFDQLFHDGDAVFIGVRNHLVPMLAEGADLLFAFRMFGNQQRLCLFPGAAAILLDVPVMRAHIGEEPFALGGVGNDAAVGNVRIVMDEDLADIENDMPYFRRHESVPDFLLPDFFWDARFCERIRNSLSDRFFHDCRQGLLFKICNRRPPSVMAALLQDRLGSPDRQSQLEMREDMRHGPCRLPVGGEGGRLDAGLAVDTGRPARCRYFGHPAEQTAFDTPAQKDFALVVDGNEGGTLSHRLVLLGGLDGKMFGIMPGQRLTRSVERTEGTDRALRRADRRAEIHHRLGKVTRPVGRREPRDFLLHQRLGGGQGRRDRIEARNDTLDIAVHHGCLAIEGDRRNGGSRIIADTGERPQAVLGIGEAAVMIGSDRLGALLQIAGASVVAEPRPRRHNVIVRRGRQIVDRRPAFQEFREIGFDRRHGRLLQHHFRQPDTIGVRLDAARCHRRRDAPGQVAVMAVVPGKQRCGRWGC